MYMSVFHTSRIEWNTSMNTAHSGRLIRRLSASYDVCGWFHPSRSSSVNINGWLPATWPLGNQVAGAAFSLVHVTLVEEGRLPSLVEMSPHMCHHCKSQESSHGINMILVAWFLPEVFHFSMHVFRFHIVHFCSKLLSTFWVIRLIIIHTTSALYYRVCFTQIPSNESDRVASINLIESNLWHFWDRLRGCWPFHYEWFHSYDTNIGRHLISW